MAGTKYIDLECGFCKKPFSRKLADYKCCSKKGQTVFYCSLDCGYKDRSTGRYTTFSCSSCGKEIKKSRCQVNHSKSGKLHCSLSCAGKSRAAATKLHAENNPNWKGGKRSYQKIVVGSCCIDCKEDKKLYLVTHHKDKNRSNNTKENLEVVCMKCHVKRHLTVVKGKIKYDTRFITTPEILEIAVREGLI